MATVYELRRQADRQQLDLLLNRSNGIVSWRKPWLPHQDQLRLSLKLSVPFDRSFPRAFSEDVALTVTLPSRYPYEGPKVSIDTSIFHPNVFVNGTVCLGTHWLPTEGLDLFVARIVRLLAFDPLLVNVTSPAHGQAAAWYTDFVLANPDQFPLLNRNSHLWLYDPRAERVIVHCPSCRGAIRLPAHKTGTVACPLCQHEFQIQT